MESGQEWKLWIQLRLKIGLGSYPARMKRLGKYVYIEYEVYSRDEIRVRIIFTGKNVWKLFETREINAIEL